LKELAGGEPVVVVSHGYPAETPDFGVSPELLEIDLHAMLLTQRFDQAAGEEVSHLKQKLAPRCRRVYGLTLGWNNLDAADMEGRAKILNFLRSDDDYPSDLDVQRWLGLNAPMARLVLRFALELAHEALADAPSGAARPPQVRALLAPALSVAQQEESLADTIDGIRRALDGDRQRLRDEVVRALAALGAE
jgi:hypothetical protein